MWSILAELRPEAVFLPFLWDNHSDHIATSRILFEATKHRPLNFRCYMWGLWSPLPRFNVKVDTSAQLEVKRRALSEFSSTAYFDLSGVVASLDYYHAFLGGNTNKAGRAEVFLACSEAEFQRLAVVAGW